MRVLSILFVNDVQSMSIKGKENMIDWILGERNLKSTLNEVNPQWQFRDVFPLFPKSEALSDILIKDQLNNNKSYFIKKEKLVLITSPVRFSMSF